MQHNTTIDKAFSLSVRLEFVRHAFFLQLQRRTKYVKQFKREQALKRKCHPILCFDVYSISILLTKNWIDKYYFEKNCILFGV